MKKINIYLEKVSKHLYKFDQNGKVFYQKVVINDDTFIVLKFNEEMELISEKSYSIDRFDSVSPNGKEYIPTELKNFHLFYKGSGYNPFVITTVPHFKKFREAMRNRDIEKYLKERKETA